MSNTLPKPKGSLWAVLDAERPLQMLGASTAYHALASARRTSLARA